MQKCSYCGADLPENSRFCGKCGSVQDATATDAAATANVSSATPRPQGGPLPAPWPPSSNHPARGSAPAWSPYVQAPATPPPATETEDERRRGIPPWSPLYGATLAGEALLGSGQAYTPGAPVVQGTPQFGSAPSVAGSPTPYANAPVANPAQGAGNAAPVGQPVQGAGNVPTQGAGNVPTSQPVQGPANPPVSHPVQGPQPIHHPPEPPGTHEPHPPHGPHRHHPHPTHHEPERHHEHATQHKPHRLVNSKVAGGSTVKTIVIVATTVVLVAAGAIGVAAHFLSHPQPLISLTSAYKVGNTPAGAPGTSLHLSGQQFSSNSAITFLLDGQVAPGNAGTRSDSNGNFSANVTITSAWRVGTHSLTARDTSNDSTKNGASVTIVPPGQANTPGPDGAPPDDATFTLNIAVQDRTTTVNQPFTNNVEALHVTGHPDAAGGTVCLNGDDGRQFSTSYAGNNGTPFTETYSFSCKGSYKSGKVSYSETLLTDVVTFNDGSGVVCTLTAPQLNQQVTGSYSGNNTFSGTWTYGPVPTSDFNCSNGGSFFYSSGNGPWTGTVSGLQK